MDRQDWDVALSLAQQALAINPDDIRAHEAAGFAALQRGRARTALLHLQHLAFATPDDAWLHMHQARALVMLQRMDEAMVHVHRARSLLPDDPMIADLGGVLLVQCGAHAEALAAFERAVELNGAHPGFRFNLATTLASAGKTAKAASHFEHCIALDPMHWRAHHALSQLQRQTPRSNHITRLQALLPRLQGHVSATLQINTALAKELHDLGEYGKAFKALEAGKRQPAALRRHTEADDDALFEALSRVRAARYSSATSRGYDSAEPIFIIGMPRSGTTLLERILGTHAEVTAAGELQNFATALKDGMGGESFHLFKPEHYAAIDDADWQLIGKRYIDSTRPLTGGTPRFTDKLPHNFLYAGMIANALPQARIILVRRNPLDTCLGNYRLAFAPESPYFDYSHDLLRVGRYYLQFDRLMKHWTQAFPGRIHEVDYEAIVSNPATTLKGVFDYCGLAWNEDVIQFHLNPTPVTTASAAQVREPLHTSSMQLWKHYRHELTPLRALLESNGIDLRETVSQ